ncbi:GNAT family N-acetyltransferase [Ruegeria sp. 2012CJ15-1]
MAQIATRDLLGPFLTSAQRAQAGVLTPIDPWLVADGTYFVAEIDGRIRASGGWSGRYQLIHQPGSDERPPPIEATGPACIRAMYSDPAFARQGLARAIVTVCETSARLSGRDKLELVATPIGQLLYLSCGYETIETLQLSEGGVSFSVFLMRKSLQDGGTTETTTESSNPT